MKIDFANLKRGYQEHKDEIDAAVASVLSSQYFILGPEVAALENELATYTGSKYAITCSSGTDALLLAMMAIDIQPGDEIITTPFTFIATAETIALMKATPVFVDIDEKTYNIDPAKIEEKITARTKAIIPVSLYGQTANMDEINTIAAKHNLIVIEDGAQSFGAEYRGKKSCNLSHIGCTSFFPAKPLGCYGDGGAVFTNDGILEEKLKSLRVHGQGERYMHKYIGMGGRLDALQAVILRIKLKYFNHDIERRQKAAEYYTKHITGNAILPHVESNRTSVWAQYSIRVKNREELQKHLQSNGIPTAVHYPMPLHLQECFQYLGYEKGAFPIAEKVSKEIMSLPMNPYFEEDELGFIVNHLQ